MFVIIVNQILKMLILLLIGILCYRLKLISQENNQALANLLLMVINPMVAITALQIEYTPHLAKGLLISYLLATVSHLLAILLFSLILSDKNNENRGIEQFSIVYSNCGFIGIPLVQSVLGGEGVLYLTAYMTLFNILTWTHGVAVMTGKTSLHDLRKGLLNPMIFACAIALVLFFSGIQLPPVLNDSMTYVANMNTPLAMIIAGVSVAQTDFLKMLHNRRLYLISAGKLLIMPALVFILLCIVRVDFIIACTILIAAACPTAASGTAFALRFRKNYTYASEIYALTTIASLFTIPFFVYLAEQFLR